MATPVASSRHGKQNVVISAAIMASVAAMDFTSEDNLAGQTLLRLVSRGSAIIAELLRLSDHVPTVFLPAPTPEKEKYGRIMFDFAYLKSPEQYDAKIDADNELLDLDEEFRDNHLVMLERFYQMFESIYKYLADLNTYINEMVDGGFVDYTIETVLLNPEGKQLLSEAVYLFGLMLLLLDRRFEGSTRETMVISYYRYKGASTIANIDEVCKLCRSTGFSASAPRPPANYPIDYFARFQIMPEVLQMIVGRLRAEDIYNQSAAYPSPEHRTTALAAQGGMLYVLLYFCPSILVKEMATMREIVDKHFADNWVINYYMGMTVDLTEAWKPFKAANAALKNIVDESVVADLNEKFSSKVPRLMATLKQLLTEGVLVEQFVLENLTKLLNTLRECNTTVRWLIMQRQSVDPKIRATLVGTVADDQVLALLLHTAQFEYQLKNLFTELLATKRARWDEYQKESRERMVELAEYFSGEKALTRIKKDENLQGWFTNLATEIGVLEFERPILTGRKITHLIQVLDEVQEFHQIETSLQIKQFLSDTRIYLTKMIRTVNVKENTMNTISIVSDFSYAWEIIRDYIPLMHARIKADPSCVIFLRATFLKLVSILDLPLLRINQCGSKDVVSVSEYYSSALVQFIRSVLEVIPRNMFRLLSEIIQLMTFQLRPLPMKVERLQLKEYSQPEMRGSLARLTHQVSVFTDGILAMDRTLYGVIEVDPKQMLEDGIRKELVTQVAVALHEYLDFAMDKKQGSNFEVQLSKLGARLDGFRRSFEYIQDYVNIYGLRMWQEEFSRIINYNVEQESNMFLQKKIYDWQSVYQSDAIPIPKFAPKDAQSVNFMGRLARELLRQTDVRNAVYVEGMQGWFDTEEREVVGIRTFDLLNRGVGIFGLAGLDLLVSFMIVRDLQSWVRNYRRVVDEPTRNYLTQLAALLHPSSHLTSDPRLYSTAVNRFAGLWPYWLDTVCRIGQIQLIRRHIANELKFTAQMDSKIFMCALENLNQAAILDVKQHYAKPEEHPYPDTKNPLLGSLNKFLETAGDHDPFSKIYVTTEPLSGFALLLFLFVLSQCSKLAYNVKWGALVRTQKAEPIDGAPFVVGVLTLLKQFHSSYAEKFINYLGQYVRFSVSASASGNAKPEELPGDVIGVLLFLEEFCKYSFLSREVVDSVIPSYIFDRFRHF